MPSPFSVRLDDDIKARLDREAERNDRSAGFIINKAVERYLDDVEALHIEMEALVAESEKGVFISEDAMMKWMASWDTDNELPPPQPDIFPAKHAS